MLKPRFPSKRLLVLSLYRKQRIYINHKEIKKITVIRALLGHTIILQLKPMLAHIPQECKFNFVGRIFATDSWTFFMSNMLVPLLVLPQS